jgi:hypothetical protein
MFNNFKTRNALSSFVASKIPIIASTRLFVLNAFTSKFSTLIHPTTWSYFWVVLMYSFADQFSEIEIISHFKGNKYFIFHTFISNDLIQINELPEYALANTETKAIVMINFILKYNLTTNFITCRLRIKSN